MTQRERPWLPQSHPLGIPLEDLFQGSMAKPDEAFEVEEAR
jgi:hypothetical protein